MVCERNCQLLQWSPYTTGIISYLPVTNMCTAHSILSSSSYWKIEGMITLYIHIYIYKLATHSSLVMYSTNIEAVLDESISQVHHKPFPRRVAMVVYS